MSGGRISRETIDQIASSKCRRLKISGLTQQSFEYLIDQYGARFRTLDLWKCPRIEDLSPLADLEGVAEISIYWNQKAERLWDMSGNRALMKVSLSDFRRLHALDELETCVSLTTLKFGDAVWKKSVIQTLQPLAGIKELKHLDFVVQKIVDGRIAPLAKIRALKTLSFPSNLFSTEKIAWLRARMEPSVKSRVLKGVHRFSRPVSHRKGRRLDTLVIGKRKPFLDSRQDAERIKRYKRQFADLVARFRADPGIPEPD